nr:zinc finger, CCHC-type [Tanacetum cinerariifolium]
MSPEELLSMFTEMTRAREVETRKYILVNKLNGMNIDLDEVERAVKQNANWAQNFEEGGKNIQWLERLYVASEYIKARDGAAEDTYEISLDIKRTDKMIDEYQKNLEEVLESLSQLNGIRAKVDVSLNIVTTTSAQLAHAEHLLSETKSRLEHERHGLEKVKKGNAKLMIAAINSDASLKRSIDEVVVSRRNLERLIKKKQAIQIKVILEAHRLWETIEPKENTKIDNKKDKATTALLYQALTEDVILQVAGCKTVKELWESLKKRHVGEEKVQQARLQSIMIGFNTHQMKDDDTLDAFTDKLNGYATKAKELGKTLDESLLVRKLLDSTPDRFVQIVASIEQTSDLVDITLDEITRKLKAFEERIKLQKGGQDESQENLLFAQGEHSRKGKRFNKHEEITQKRETQTTKETQIGTKEQSNLILEEDDEPSLLMTTHETEHKEVLLNEGKIQPEKYASGDASMWYLDNGASNHMTETKSHFKDIDESISGR